MLGNVVAHLFVFPALLLDFIQESIVNPNEASLQSALQFLFDDPVSDEISADDFDVRLVVVSSALIES